MTRRTVVLWWALVLCHATLSGITRQHARYDGSIAANTNHLVAGVEGLLREAGMDDVTPILEEEGVIGYSYHAQECEAPLQVITMTISVLAESVAEDHARKGERFLFRYLNHQYESGSRVLLTWHWVKNELGYAVRLSSSTPRFRRSKYQLALLWPKNCNLPEIDWVRAWETS